MIGAGDRVPSNLPTDGHSFRRVEVLTGTPRRRRWSDEEKAAIVAESQAPGAQASEIALRYGLHRNQLYGCGGSSDRLPMRWPRLACTDPILLRWWRMAVRARRRSRSRSAGGSWGGGGGVGWGWSVSG